MGKLYLGTQAITPILNRGGGGGNEPGGNIKITAYDTTTGVISGGGFGSTPGYVYVLDRDTNTYVPQTVSSWTPSSITLSTPVDLTTLEGTTSMAVVADDGTWSNKWLLTGDVAVSGWGKLYVQNPDTRAIYTVAVDNQTDFNKLYTPVVSSTVQTESRQIVIGNNTFYADEVVGMQFGSNYTGSTLSDRFLGYMVNLVQPVVLPSAIENIGTYFLAACRKFNQPITVPSTVTNIGGYFLYQCPSFNHSIIIPNSLSTIPDFFLSSCYNFNQPITIPTNIGSIGSYFLANGYAFNQPITIPSSVTTIGGNFLGGCLAFNQPITIPSSVTTIGESFLSSCSTFNQPIAIPNGVTSIGNYFMRLCSSFNQPLTIPSGVTSIGNGLLYRSCAFSNLTVNTTASPTDTESLSVIANYAKMYVKGVTVKGTGRSAWLSALPNRAGNPYRRLIDGGE